MKLFFNNIFVLGTVFVALFISSNVYGDRGIVVKEDVGGSGNSVIETTDGWFVAAEHYSGVYLYEGDVVYGDLKSYGFKNITRSDGRKGRFYIEDYETNLEELTD